jgi:glycosyltransferase involved in cell wall biosynthesis
MKRVLYLCGREPAYIRNRMIIKALGGHFRLDTITDNSGTYLVRHLRLVLKCLLRRARTPSYDVVFVGFYGYFLIFLARLLWRCPVVFDAYVSNYNTLCMDRKLFRPDSLLGRLAFWLDCTACRLADVVVVDTYAHARYFATSFGIPDTRFAVIYLGCDETIFFPRQATPSRDFLVFYYGSYLPLQGIEYIIRAAKLLEHEPDVRFRIAGDGQGYAEIRTLVERLNVRNVEFMKWVPFEDLPLQIAQATICLGGHFSDIDKASNVIATKTFQFLAMRKPTIVGQNGANGEAFVHGEHVYMCAMADARALADAILALRRNEPLRQHIAEGGYALFLERYQSALIAENIRTVVDSSASAEF